MAGAAAEALQQLPQGGNKCGVARVCSAVRLQEGNTRSTGTEPAVDRVQQSIARSLCQGRVDRHDHTQMMTAGLAGQIF